MKKNRFVWVDELKGVLIIMVVLGHSIQAVGLPLDGFALIKIIETLQMPLFMMVSGYLLYKNELRPQDLGRKCKRLLIPFASWAVLGFRGDWSYWQNVIERPDRALWFLWVLASIVAIVYLLNYVARRFGMREGILQWGVTLAMIFCIAISGLNKFGVQLISWYLPFVLCGFYIRKRQELVQKHRAMLSGISIFMLAVYAVGLVFWRWKASVEFPFGVVLSGALSNLYCIVVELLGSISIFIIFVLHLSKVRPKVSPIANLGIMTLGVYAMHQLIIKAVARVIPAMMNVQLKVALLFLTGLVSSIVLVLLIRKSKSLRFLLIGE